jgi:hypothetical protein
MFLNNIMVVDRALLFLLVCIPVRLSFVYISKTFTHKYAQILMGIIGLIIGIGFVNSFITNAEVGFFGGKAWWHNLRIIHAFNYIIFGLLTLLYKYKKAYLILLLDIIIGLLGYYLIN